MVFLFSLVIDINECKEGTNECQQQCVNTAGSYGCSCVDGYSLQPDGVSCTLLGRSNMHVYRKELNVIYLNNSKIVHCWIAAPQQTCDNMNCSQGCSVNATGSAFCFCNQGYTLLSDGKNCTGKRTFTSGKFEMLMILSLIIQCSGGIQLNTKKFKEGNILNLFSKTIFPSCFKGLIWYI